MTRRRRLLIAGAAIALCLALALLWLAQPKHFTRLVAHRAGAALGLQIDAAGVNEYRLRGMPLLVLRDVTVREPGAAVPLLTARRILVELPWSTVRAGGSELAASRIELDTPHLDLPALQHWLATRPPSARRLPTLTRGLRIRDGQVQGPDWTLDAVRIDLPRLQPSQVLRARLQARYQDATRTAPLDLAVTVVHPNALIDGSASGFAVHGRLGVEQGSEWSLRSVLTLSGPLRLLDDETRIAPMRLAVSAELVSADGRWPFALGAHGPLRISAARTAFAPAGLALRPRGDRNASLLPELDAGGSAILGHRLQLDLQGRLADWPATWPALPPPIGQSTSALPFVLRYAGTPDFSESATLHLQRDATRFDSRFRLPQVLDWSRQSANGSPLPPLQGTLQSPRIEVAGATLDGVEVQLDDDATSP